MSKLISLTQGKFSSVDDEKFKELNQYKWQAVKNHNVWYVTRNSYSSNKRRVVFMHREILGLKKGDGIKTDHKDGNGLNNQRCNLRICTNAENQYNQKRQTKDKSSQFKGVSWNKADEIWRARIGCNGKTYLGRFNNEADAAIAYDRAAKERFGEFARLNFDENRQNKNP